MLHLLMETAPSIMKMIPSVYTTSCGNETLDPIASRARRGSCMQMWNTTEEGPCFIRPTSAGDPENPTVDTNPMVYDCYDGEDAEVI